jgi:hypothetical protein
MREVVPDHWQQALALCQTLSELVLIADRLAGREAVEAFLTAVRAEHTGQELRAAADQLQTVGLIDLSRLVRQHARRGRKPKLRDQRHTASALVAIARRRAEAGMR